MRGCAGWWRRQLIAPALLWLVAAAFAAQPYSDGVHVLDDLTARWGRGQVVGALLAPMVRTAQSGGISMLAGSLYPTTRPARNVFSVALPAVNAGDLLVLTAWVGIDDHAHYGDSAQPRDGVRVRLLVENQQVAEVECNTPGWHPLAAELTAFAGETVKVAFEVDPKGNPHHDWAYIAQAQVLRLRERFALKVGRTLPPEGVLEVRGVPGERFTLNAPNYPPWQIMVPRSGVIWLRYAFTGARNATLAESPAQAMVRVYPFQPRLRLDLVASRRALLAPNETAEVVVRVRNVGAGTWQNDRITLSVQPLSDVELLSRPDLAPDLLPPGASAETRFRVRVGTRPRLVVFMRSGAGSDAWVLNLAVAQSPATPPAAGMVARVQEGVGVLQNEQLRLIVSPASTGGYAARLFAKAGNSWMPIAVSVPLADAVLNAEGAPPKLQHLVAESLTADPAAMRLLIQGRMGLTARAAVEFRLEGNRLHCVGRLVADHNTHLYRFRFPDWRVGDGSFGDAKDEALFPGLEYLLGEEPSSSVAFVMPPYHLRFAPDPYKITAPVMAVRWREYLVSLEWDATQSWAGALRVPNALFASPNFLEGGANHRFALWVPTTPRWADENTLQAREPFRLIKGNSVVLQATLVVRTDARDISEAIEQYLQRVGMPYPPAPQRNDFGALQLTVQGLLNSYDLRQNAWLHTHTGPATRDPEVALGLWVLAHRLFPEDGRRRLAREQVRSVISALPKGEHGVDLAFYIGGLASALERTQRAIDALIQQQRDDGSWAWRPETPRHTMLGKPGGSTSGWTAQRAAGIGRFAMYTLAPQARASLLRSLRYLATQRRPEGAQLSELPLRVPDLLAVPYAIHACLDAYALTGELQWLAQARRWAWRGTPFIYLWHAPDKPIMRGASIPAFGASWLNQQPWFGVAAPSSGLVYARALYRLASVDKQHDWKRLADTITLCAVQQQEWVSDRRADREGFYPSAFNILHNAEAHLRDLNPYLIAPCIAQRLGFTVEPITQIVREGERLIACTAPGLQTATLRDGVLQLQIAPPASDLPALYVLIAGVRSPAEVRLNGAPLPKVEDIDSFVWELIAPHSGWTLHSQGLLLRIVNPTSATIEVVGL